MTHSEVIKLRNDLNTIQGIKSDELNYAIAENIERANTAIKPLIKQEAEINDIIKEFNSESKVIGEKYATIDGEVKIKREMISNQIIESFDIPQSSKKEYYDGLSSLKEKYAEKIKEHEERVSTYTKFIEETESPIVLFTIKMAHVPKDILTEHMKAIFPFIRKKE